MFISYQVFKIMAKVGLNMPTHVFVFVLVKISPCFFQCGTTQQTSLTAFYKTNTKIFKLTSDSEAISKFDR